MSDRLEDDTGTFISKPDQEYFHAKYNDASASVRLVSSDGVTFEVPKYQLQAASIGFRDLMGSHHDDTATLTLELVDKVIETSAVIRLFLDYINGDWFPATDIELLPRLVDPLMQFLHKWACGRLYIRSIEAALPKLAHSKCPVWQLYGALNLASRYREEDGGHALAEIVRTNLPRRLAHPCGQGLALDPVCISVKFLRDLDLRTSYALNQAFHAAPGITLQELSDPTKRDLLQSQAYDGFLLGLQRWDATVAMEEAISRANEIGTKGNTM